MLNRLCAAAAIALLTASGSHADELAPKTFSEALGALLKRPEFRHASFGVEVFDLDAGRPVFALNADKLFTPGSTTKLLTEGTALKLLGPDYRFHTPIYRTGELDRDGVVHGDLVLVAKGDPNLSNRRQPDGTLAFADEDHTYGGPEARLIPGDPLVVLRSLAKQVAAAGVRRVTGRVLVDVTLFPEGDREMGTGVVISPIAVNDNVVDLTITPGAALGAPATLTIAPQVQGLTFVNEIVTGEGSEILPEGPEVAAAADGSTRVVLRGTIGRSSGPVIYGFPAPSPSLFAAGLLTQVLKEEGVVVAGVPGAITKPGPEVRAYTPAHQLAEHVSAPFSEEVKVTLKVSHNLHASMTPLLLGAVLGGAHDHYDAKGFELERAFLKKAGLDLSGASQSDGAGGATAAFYTPDFMVRYLAYMARQPEFPIFLKSLPVLGRDGTLVNIQRQSPGAGHVFAKTGTFVGVDLLNDKPMLLGKGLAGYTTTPAGRRLAIALYLNHLELADGRAPSEVAGQALGEVASAIYALPLDKPEL